MNTQMKAYGLSVLIHAVLAACVFAAGVFAPKQKTIVLDFSIGRPAAVAHAAAPKQSIVQREQKIVKPVEKSDEAVPVKTQDQDIPAPQTQQAVNAHTGEQAEGGYPSAAGNTGEAAKANYISAQFILIRDRIMRSLVYPMIARKMGWSGRVKIAFTVREDGGVEDINVIESSGFTVLDKNAIETIKKSCPLPKPPMKVALVMPVVYRLE